MPGDLLEGLLVEVDGVGAPVDVLVGPAEADKVGDDDAVAAGGEERDDAVKGLRPEGLSVQAQDHLEGEREIQRQAIFLPLHKVCTGRGEEKTFLTPQGNDAS